MKSMKLLELTVSSVGQCWWGLQLSIDMLLLSETVSCLVYANHHSHLTDTKQGKEETQQRNGKDIKLISQ